MNWTKLYHRVPERVRVAIGGLLLGAGVLAAPRLLAWWIIFWS